MARQAIDWALLDPSAENPVAVGDVLSVDAGGMPIFRVVAVADGRVSLKDERHPPVDVASLDAFRWRGVGV